MLIGLAAVVSLFTILWLASLAVNNASIVDMWWGPGIFLIGLTYFLSTDGAGVRRVLVLTCVALWAARLAIHIGRRNIGHGEDFRYAVWRTQYGARWWWVSYLRVFVLQAVIAWIIALPLYFAIGSAEPDRLTAWDGAGAALFAIGFWFEAIGDEQLRRFKANPVNAGTVHEHRPLALHAPPQLFRRGRPLVGFRGHRRGHARRIHRDHRRRPDQLLPGSRLRRVAAGKDVEADKTRLRRVHRHDAGIPAQAAAPLTVAPLESALSASSRPEYNSRLCLSHRPCWTRDVTSSTPGSASSCSGTSTRTRVVRSGSTGRSQASWDPRQEITGYADLDRFGEFQDEWLRGGPVRRWVPKGFAGQPVYTFETGGSTGVPKSRINITDFRTDYETFSGTLSDEKFPKGADWLMVGPSGPRRLRLAIEHLAQYRGGICFMVDLDPRWVIKLIKMGEMEMMELYKRHVIDQALTLLKAHDGIKCLFTTPKLLEALCERISLKKAGITGVFCGGTEMTPQFHRFAVEELMEGAYFAPTYGNTLMGLATHKPAVPEDNWAVIYYPPLPKAMIEIVDPDNPTRVVDYGQTGRVRLTTLSKEFFMPRFLERDEAEREPPCDLYPWDGVRNVRPFSRFQKSVVEGVY